MDRSRAAVSTVDIRSTGSGFDLKASVDQATQRQIPTDGQVAIGGRTGGRGRRNSGRAHRQVTDDRLIAGESIRDTGLWDYTPVNRNCSSRRDGIRREDDPCASIKLRDSPFVVGVGGRRCGRCGSRLRLALGHSRDQTDQHCKSACHCHAHPSLHSVLLLIEWNRGGAPGCPPARTTASLQQKVRKGNRSP